MFRLQPNARFVLRWDEGDTVESKALEAPLLGEAAARGPGGARQIREAFIRRLAFIRGTQEAQMTGLLHHEEGFDRGARLLATRGVLLVLGIGGAGDRALRAIMPTRGSPGATLGRTGWTELLARSGLMQHTMEEMNPGRRLCLGHAKELAFLRGEASASPTSK